MKALIVGAGPALKKFDHIAKLAKSNFDGHLFIVDVMLKKCLEAGITPDRFPNFHVVSVEFGTFIQGFYMSDIENDLTKKYAPKIHALLFAEQGEFIDKLKNIGFNVEMMSNDIMTQIFANVGITGWYLAHKKYGCDSIALIGFNMGWPKDYPNDFPPRYAPFWTIGHNPDLNTDYALDPLYEYYRDSFLEAINNLNVNTINCTGDGSLYAPKITNMEFEKWLAI